MELLIITLTFSVVAIVAQFGDAVGAKLGTTAA